MRFILLILLSLNIQAFAQGRIIGADNIQGVDVEKNYIPNGLAENFNVIGWNRYDDGSVARPVDGTGGTADYISIAHTTTSPLEDKGSFLITKTANNARGEGLSIDFKVPRAKLGERQCVFIDYEITSGTFTAGTDTTDSDLIAYIYDKDAAQTIEPENFKFFSIGQDKFGGCFSPFNIASDDYRLILHVANTNANAWTMKIDNVKVGVRNTPRGAVVTDWQSYTPTITHSSGGATNYTVVGKWRQVGDTMEVTGTATFSAASAAFNEWYFSLPSGYSVDVSKLNILSPGLPNHVGTGNVYDSGLQVFAPGNVLLRSSTVLELRSPGTLVGTNPIDVTTEVITNTNPITFAVGDTISWKFAVPIQGWSSNTRMSDGYEGRDVSTYAYRDAAQSLAPNNSAVKVLLNSVAPLVGGRGFDTVSAFNSANNRIDIKSSGKYRVSGAVAVKFNNTLTSGYYPQIWVNGIYWGRGTYVFPQAGAEFSTSVNITLDLKAGDYIELYLFGFGNNSVNQLTLNTGPGSTYLIVSKEQSGQTIAAPPLVTASYNTSTARTINNTSPTIIYENKRWDSHNAYNTTTGEYVVPVAGYYYVQVFFRTFGHTGAISNVVAPGVFVNGTFIANLAGARRQTTSSTQLEGNGSFITPLKAGDRVTIRTFSDVSTTLQSADSQANYFTIQRMN